MCFSSGGGDGGAAAAAATEANRQASITQGQGDIDKAFSGFTPDFYNAQSQAYTDYAQPQLDRQWTDAQQQLHYALDRGGIYDSSAASKAESDAQYTHDQAEQALQTQAQQTSQDTQTKVAQARASLSGQLNADANAGEASSGAAAQSALLGLKPSFSPIGNMFQNVTGDLSLYAQGYPILGTPGYVGPLGLGGPSTAPTGTSITPG